MDRDYFGIRFWEMLTRMTPRVPGFYRPNPHPLLLLRIRRESPGQACWECSYKAIERQMVQFMEPSSSEKEKNGTVWNGKETTGKQNQDGVREVEQLSFSRLCILQRLVMVATVIELKQKFIRKESCEKGITTHKKINSFWMTRKEHKTDKEMA